MLAAEAAKAITTYQGTDGLRIWLMTREANAPIGNQNYEERGSNPT